MSVQISEGYGSTRAYYDTFSNSYEDHRHEGYHRYLDEAELAILDPHLPGAEVLEVGCGTGLILERIARRSARAVGIDLSPGMLERARERGLDVHEASATALPFSDASFDLVCSFKVLAHVPDIDVALSEMARVTRPGGRVVAEFYNSRSIRHLVKRLKPATRIGAATATTDEDVYTRYDSLEDILAYAPDGLALERVDGIRMLSPVATLFNLPVLGPVWTAVERAAGRSPLRHLGGFLVVTWRR